MRSLAFCFALVLASCSSATTPPAQWSTGGAPILIPEAQWRDEDGTQVDIRKDGAVLVNGGLLFSLDPAGRVYDQKGAGAAVLLANGHLAGAESADLGVIGVGNAAPASRNEAWISVQPNGDVLYVEDDGSRHAYGRWKGCDGGFRRTCTLVTHLVTLHRLNVQSASNVWVGMGAGFYR